MNLTDLRGSIVALVTPFDAENRVDFSALENLVDWHLESGTDGIVVAGTTGETPTLSDTEYAALIEHVVTRVDGRIPVIAGAGSNSTEETILRARNAVARGADGLLLVTPYYNKPTQAGLLAHFDRIAGQLDAPIILYNVPGRTGCNLLPETAVALHRSHRQIIGVKEASGDMLQIMDLIRTAPDTLAVYSGDDALALPVALLGGRGCISVVANQIPADFHALLDAAGRGDVATARALHERYLPLMQLNFIESNPVPVKTALAMMGRLTEHFRLPLVPLAPANRDRLVSELRRIQLVETRGAA
jgi:4-hydroxy-tetrahydrodipicolinate synthase